LTQHAYYSTRTLSILVVVQSRCNKHQRFTLGDRGKTQHSTLT